MKAVIDRKARRKGDTFSVVLRFFAPSAPKNVCMRGPLTRIENMSLGSKPERS